MMSPAFPLSPAISSFSRALRAVWPLLAEIVAGDEQGVEGEEDQPLRLAVGKRGLQRGEVGNALRIDRADLAVIDAVAQALAGSLGDLRKLVGPVEALAGPQARIAILDPQLHAIAVELQLMDPALAARRPVDHGGKLRLDEIRHAR